MSTMDTFYVYIFLHCTECRFVAHRSYLQCMINGRFVKFSSKLIRKIKTFTFENFKLPQLQSSLWSSQQDPQDRCQRLAIFSCESKRCVFLFVRRVEVRTQYDLVYLVSARPKEIILSHHISHNQCFHTHHR